jgi:hypothetical protein
VFPQRPAQNQAFRQRAERRNARFDGASATSADIVESIRERRGIATGTSFSSSELFALPMTRPQVPCRSQDGAHDPLVPGTATEIAADCDPHRGSIGIFMRSHAVISMPGAQKPHCSPYSWWNASLMVRMTGSVANQPQDER